MYPHAVLPTAYHAAQDCEWLAKSLRESALELKGARVVGQEVQVHMPK
jgi:hypothetical protein